MITRRFFLLSLLLGIVCIAWSKVPLIYKIQPTYANIKYGSHERNVFDLWIAKSDVPAPLVIFVHGGGFVGGCKESLDMSYLEKLLANGMSVAALHYRFCDGEKNGALASIADVRYALQYLRSRSKEWSIDKERIGMWGGSAGSGATLWITFHDELANPKAKDPVLRESSRLQAACGIAIQATYDTFKWASLLSLPENSFLLEQLHSNSTLKWLGIKSIDAKDTPHGLKMRKELDIISMITPDDPPFFVLNTVEGIIPPQRLGLMIHHPLFAKMIYEKGKECKIDCHIYTPKAPEYGFNDPLTPPDFFISHLK